MHDRTRSSLVFAALLLTSACSDHDKKDLAEDDGSAATAPDGGGASSGLIGDASAGGSIDGGPGANIDGSTITLPDGAVVTQSPDGSTALASDAASHADASGDASVHCDVNDPRYGCGALSGSDWLSFPDFEVDLKNGTAWTRPVTVVDDDALRAICPVVSAGGFAWDMPQTEDVRQLAAGCAKTMPGGSCQVYVDEVYADMAGDCTCDQGLVGPNHGKFCRPEIPDCETLWIWTHTDETGFYQHWFYDVKTGSIVREYVGVGIALEAKGRCFHKLLDSELPATAAQQ
jgi:hypothetical protein